MIGVHVGLEGVLELKAQLLDKRRVAPRLLEYRIDQHRFAARVVGEQIRVRRGLRIEQLTKDHRGRRKIIAADEKSSRQTKNHRRSRKIMRFARIPPLRRVVSSAVEHCSHTAGATGSIPVRPTNSQRLTERRSSQYAKSIGRNAL